MYYIIIYDDIASCKLENCLNAYLAVMRSKHPNLKYLYVTNIGKAVGYQIS